MSGEIDRATIFSTPNKVSDESRTGMWTSTYQISRQGLTQRLPDKPHEPNPAHILEFLDDLTIKAYNLTNALLVSDSYQSQTNSPHCRR